MPTKHLSVAVVAFALALPVLVANHAAAQATAPDWKNDAPGRAHRIDVAALPAPARIERRFPADRSEAG